MVRKFEIVTRKAVWALSSPAQYDEIQKVLREAREEYRKLTGESWDNIPYISAHDDEIRVWFDLPEKS